MGGGGALDGLGGARGGRVVNICNFENKIELGFWTTLSVETHFWTPHKIACNLTWAGRGGARGSGELSGGVPFGRFLVIILDYIFGPVRTPKLRFEGQNPSLTLCFTMWDLKS